MGRHELKNVKRLLGTTLNTCWFYMIRTHDCARVGAPNCESIISGASGQLLKFLNTYWFYMIRTHDPARVGAPNCKHITFDTYRQLLTTLSTFDSAHVLHDLYT